MAAVKHGRRRTGAAEILPRPPKVGGKAEATAEAAYSTDSCHLVHRKVATQSTRTLPPNPQDCCHPVHVNAATWTMKVATHARRSLPPSEQRDAGSLLLV